MAPKDLLEAGADRLIALSRSRQRSSDAGAWDALFVVDRGTLERKSGLLPKSAFPV
jgi:hypothetical protein